MKTTNLSGQSVEWKIKGEAIGRITSSNLHSKARALLKTLFPTAQIKEEVPIPVNKGQTLYFDFYIPIYQVGIEIHGEQHYKFVPYFHGTAQAYAASKKNDRDKEAWCALNNIYLIILPFDEDTDDWTKRIRRWGEGEDGCGNQSP